MLVQFVHSGIDSSGSDAPPDDGHFKLQSAVCNLAIIHWRLHETCGS